MENDNNENRHKRQLSNEYTASCEASSELSLNESIKKFKSTTINRNSKAGEEPQPSLSTECQAELGISVTLINNAGEQVNSVCETPNINSNVSYQNSPRQSSERISVPRSTHAETENSFQPASVTQGNGKAAVPLPSSSSAVEKDELVTNETSTSNVDEHVNSLCETPNRNSKSFSKKSPRQPPKKKESVQRKTHAGVDYQKVLQVLIRNRGLKNPGSLVGCEIRGVGSFDDIVYMKYGTENHADCRFFQIKHVNRITTDELFQTEVEEVDLPNNSLSLLRCFSDFCRMKKNSILKDGNFDEVSFITGRDIEFRSEEDKCLLKEEKWDNGVLCWTDQNVSAEKYSLLKDNIVKQKQRFVDFLYEHSIEQDHSETIDDFFENFRIIVRYTNFKWYNGLKGKCKEKNNVFRYVQNQESKAYSVIKRVTTYNKSISSTELLKTNVRLDKPAKDFNLFSYFTSYLKIKEKHKFMSKNIEELTIVSTRVVDKKIIEFLILEEDLKSDECLYLENTKAKKYKLNICLEQIKKSIEDFIKKHSFKSKEDEIRQFLSKIRLVVSHPQLDELKKIVFREVFGHALNESEVILQDFILYQEGKQLQTKTEFLECEKWRSSINEWVKILNEYPMAMSVSKLTIDTMLAQVSKEYSFRNDDLLKNIRKFVDPEDQDQAQMKEKSVFYVLVKNVTFSSIAVLHTLTKDNEVNRENIRCYTLEHLAISPMLINSLLEASNSNLDRCTIVIYDEEKNFNNSNVKLAAKQIQRKLISSGNKIILISTTNNFNAVRDEDHYRLNEAVRSEELSFGFKDLSDDMKQKVLSTPIIFQGDEVSLKTLISDQTFASNVIDERFLWEIVRRQDKNISIGQSVDINSDVYDKGYLIPRYVFRRTVDITKIGYLIQNYLFIILHDKNNEDVCNLKVELQKGIGKNQIRQWIISKTGDMQNLIEISEQPPFKGNYTLDNGLVLMHIDDYHTLVKDSKLKVHSHPRFLMMFKGCDLYFIDSYAITNNSDSSLLTDPNICTSVEIDESSLSENICILAADSGSGKSTFIMTYTKDIKDSDSSVWAVRVELRRFCNEKMREKINKWGNVSKSKNAIKIVSEMALGDDFENKFYYQLLELGMKKGQKPNFKLILLLDGYNEINDKFQDIIRKLIRTLVAKCNYHQIWITTQSNKKAGLEIDLKRPATFLSDLSPDDQEKLMALYWKKHYENLKINAETNNSIASLDQPEKALEMCAKNYLIQDAKIALNQLRESINDSPFSVVCLNVIMLADYLILRGHRFERIIDLPTLYNEFFIKRLDTCAKTGQSCENVDVAKNKCFLINMRDIHEEVSANYYFKLYFEPKDFHSLPKMEKLDRFVQTQITGASENSEGQSKDVISKIGVLTYRGDEFDFYHESFAQFFLSEFLLKNIDNSAVQNILFNFILVNDDLKLCRKFIEKSLKNIYWLKKIRDTESRLLDSSDPFEIKLQKKITRKLNVQSKSVELGKTFIEEKLLFTLILFLTMQTRGDINIFLKHIQEKFNWASFDMKNKNLFKKSDKRNSSNRYRWYSLATFIMMKPLN